MSAVLFVSKSRKDRVAVAEAPAAAVRRAAGRCVVESLEGRQLLTATVVTPLGSVTGQPGQSSAIDLNNNFDDPTVNSQVRFATELGNIDLTLLDAQKPVTVRNFLSYVRSGAYNGTIVHRSANLSTSDPAALVQIIQGGGYTPPVNPVTHITTAVPITNEAATNGVVSNTRGTIAMARTNDPNSATSEWFINTTDNAVLDPGGGSAGYAVFGNTTPASLPVVDAIAALPRFDVTGGSQTSPFIDVPLRNFTAGQTPGANNFVTVTATATPKLTYTATSSNPALVTPTVDPATGRLTLQYGQGTGTAQVMVTASEAGSSVSDVLAVQVGTTTVTLGGASGAKSVSFTDADGTKATVSVKGSGTATINFNGTGLTQATKKGKVTVSGAGASVASIGLTGTAANTSVTISGKGGNKAVDVGGLTADGPVKAITGKTANLTGNLTMAGPVASINLASATGSTITTGGSGASRAASIVFTGTATNTSIASSAPLKTLSAAAFAAGPAGAGQTSGTGNLTAPSVAAIVTKGDFNENVTLTGSVRKFVVGGNLGGTITADTLPNVAVKGNVSGATIVVSRPFTNRERTLGSLKVTGGITNSSIRASGNVGAVSAASLTGSSVYAGIASTVTGTTLPATSTDFASQASIASVAVKGNTSGSTLAAFDLGKLSLGQIQAPTAGAASFGLAADTIALVTGKTAAGGNFTLRKLNTPTDVTTQTTGLDLSGAQILVI